jgi:hypothetical protein
LYSERAKILLQDDMFLYLVDKQKELYINNILNSAEDDVELRERSIIKLRAIDEFMASIESISVQDKVEKKRLKIF